MGNYIPMITASPIPSSFSLPSSSMGSPSTQQIEMLRLENQRLIEFARLKIEHDRLESTRRENEKLYQLEKSKRESLEEMERLKLGNQRMQEFALLKAERDSLEKAKKEAEEIGLLREENKRLKRLAKNSKTIKKAVA